jgi:hypothetical protein
MLGNGGGRWYVARALFRPLFEGEFAMSTEDFMKEQYLALRDEIKEAKAASFGCS